VAALHHVMAIYFQVLNYFRRKNETLPRALEAESGKHFHQRHHVYGYLRNKWRNLSLLRKERHFLKQGME
jgi:hypothetical protein